MLDLREPDEDQLWFFPTWAAAYAEVGRMDDALKVVKGLLLADPEWSISERVNITSQPYKIPEQFKRYVNALCQAGLPEGQREGF